MLDIKFIRENADLVQKSANDKGYAVDIATMLQLDDERRDLQKQVEALREQRNAISAKMKGGRPDQELIDQGKQLKIELAEREGYLKSTEEKVAAILKNCRTLPLMMCRDPQCGRNRRDNLSQLAKQLKEKPMDSKIKQNLLSNETIVVYLIIGLSVIIGTANPAFLSPVTQ